ncbi:MULTISPECIES: acyl-CoA dehydratase activase-related protein [unclassified Caldicellulosiruptor]|uniref:acyl-CoA dehydratase activase-related protein n=1 Tax=unclassified Caldicellulosiruptor TaxID=2622462 RepID=UPI0003A2BD9F|nr:MULTISPECIES: acyl-CoA dehydratase activase-related protein [unclassified Caldicellulosiruptor]
MKITFPHMGNLYMIAKPLFEELGFEVIVPPLNNRKTLEIGKNYSPEFICMPFKLNIGNFVQAIEMGADTIVMFGGCGPCRFGYYGALQKEILKDAGFDVQMIVIEPLHYGIENFLSEAGKVFAQKNLIGILPKIYSLAKMIDRIEKRVHFLRPREMVKGNVDRIYNRFRIEALKTKGIEQMKKLTEATTVLLDNVYVVDENVKKIGIVGEIYTIIDDFANLNIEKIIGEMGYEVERNLYISYWIDNHLIYPLLRKRDIVVKRHSKDIMKNMIGGHARETIAYAKWFESKHFAGIVHVFPLTCMPEIVAKSILADLRNEFRVPLLHIVVDEMESDVGLKTRLEAFLDLIESRSEKSGQAKLLSWN